MKRRFITAAFAAALTLSMAGNAFAAGWQKNDTGWWYGTNVDNTTWYANEWQWIDGNGDGVAESYCFDANGYLYTNTTTPDGYTVNADGAWTENGVVQTKAVSVSGNTENTTVASGNEIAQALARARAAGAGYNQSKYNASGYRITTSNGNTWNEVAFTMDANGMLISPNSGIGVIFDGQGSAGNRIHNEEYVGGSDKSIALANDPSNGNLQPNWLYNPSGKVSDAPGLLTMYKTIYNYDLSIEYGGKAGTTYVIEGMDTTGSWVYAGNPTGSGFVDGSPGTVTGWRYRFADGTYAANGIVPIYELTNSAGNLIGCWYVFNPDGFLIKDSVTVNSFGQVYEPGWNDSPYYMWWYWDK